MNPPTVCIVFVATFLAVLTRVYGQCSKCSQCTYSDFKECFGGYSNYNPLAGTYDIPIETQCSLFQETQTCLEGFSSKCPADVWRLYTSTYFNGRKSVQTTCCSDAYKPVYKASEPCFTQYLQQYIDCFSTFENVNPYVNPSDEVAHSIPCCRFLATLYCNAKVYVPNCPAAASLLKTIASKITDNTITSCSKASLLTSCCSVATLANVFNFLNLKLDVSIIGLDLGLDLGLGK